MQIRVRAAAGWLAMASLSLPSRGTTLKNHSFDIACEAGGITSLKRVSDAFDTNYVWDGKAIGQVVLRYRSPGGEWMDGGTAGRPGPTPVETQDAVTIAWPASEGPGSPISIEERFTLKGDALTWTIDLSNHGSSPVEIGDLGLPLPFATNYRPDSKTIFEQRVIRHSFISGDNSFIFCERPSGVGPYLLMTPLPGTRLEYYADHERSWTAYILAMVQANETDAGSTWRQPVSSRTLAPAGVDGDRATYAFRFTWAPDYGAVRHALVREGLIDVRVAPGMVIPRGMPAMFSLRTAQPIRSIKAEFPADSTVRRVPGPEAGTHVYRVAFKRLGENRLTINYGNGARTYLEFFSTLPLESLIAKRAEFLVRKQQYRGTGKWYDGLFSIWDMKAGVLRSPDDTGGLRDYMVGGSDDPSNCKAPYVALKNLSFPVQSEIDAVEYHLEHFVWGGLQRKDTETPYPYGIYGIDNWHQLRNSKDGFGSNGKGQEHIWRSFDYPALYTLYHAMYKIARRYPGLTHYLDADGYLDRAFGTAKAFFEIPSSIKGYWGEYTDWSYKTGEYNEVCLPELIEDLRREGRADDARYLERELEKKVKYFTYDAAYPYGSEYAFDSTAFETTQVLARYGVTHDLGPDERLWQDPNTGAWYSHPAVKKADFSAFLERQMAANIADRGWLEPAYYLMGSDIRGGGNAHYLLSYMAQMGGWAVLDYALHFSATPEEHVGLGYASYLSSWAIVNAGDAASNYGFWFPGEVNDGAAGWAYEPLKVAKPWYGIPQGRGAWSYDGEIDHGFLGALRSAATIVVNDPVFGLFTYGGSVAKTADGLKVTPMDGLRQRLHFLTLKPALHLEMEQDGIQQARIEIGADIRPRLLSLRVDNRSGGAHQAVLHVAGLPEGTYRVRSGRSSGTFCVEGAGDTPVILDIPAKPLSTVTIEADAPKMGVK